MISLQTNQETLLRKMVELIGKLEKILQNEKKDNQ